MESGGTKLPQILQTNNQGGKGAGMKITENKKQLLCVLYCLVLCVLPLGPTVIMISTTIAAPSDSN